MIKEHINSFGGGMNSDVSPIADSISSVYTSALNGRIISELGSSMFSFENIKGNIISQTIPATSNIIQVTVPDPTVLTTDLFNGCTQFDVQLTRDGVNILNNTITPSDALWPTNESFSNTAGFNQFMASMINGVNDEIHAVTKDDILYVYDSLGGQIELFAFTDVNLYTFGYVVGNNVMFSDYMPRNAVNEIIGYAKLRESFILFTTSAPGAGAIWLLEYDEVTLEPTLTLKYNNFIDLSIDHPIQAVSRYENTDIQRVVFTDNYNYIRSFNIADPTGFVMTPDGVNMFPAFSFSIAQLEQITTSGNLEAGVYQLAYRLRRTSGTTSTLARPSNTVSIFAGDEGTAVYTELVGNNKGDITGKAIEWSINNLDTSFQYLEPIIIKRITYEGIPLIHLLDAIPIPRDGSITLSYSGLENFTSINLEEYLILSTNFFTTAKTLTTSNNMLVVANVRSAQKLDLPFDARAYNFNPAGVTFLPIDLGNTETWGIDEEADIINPDYTTTDFHYNPNKYKYRADGVTLGGEGPNVSYRFVTQGLLEDKRPPGYGVPTSSFIGFDLADAPLATPLSTTSADQLLNGVTYNVTSAIPNLKSAYLSGLYRGYKRGETYRFGLVFYDLRGNAGYVKHIADIKCPRINENSGNPGATNSGNNCDYELLTKAPNNEFYSNQLGIRFSVTIPLAIASQISGFSIVRVKRELKDRSILGSGIIVPIQDGGTKYQLPSSSISFIGTPFINGQEQQNIPDLGNPAASSLVGYAAKDIALFFSPEFQFNSAYITNPLKFDPANHSIYIDNYVRSYDGPIKLTGYLRFAKLYSNDGLYNITGANNISPFYGAKYVSKLKNAKKVDHDTSNGDVSWFPNQSSTFFVNTEYSLLTGGEKGFGEKAVLLNTSDMFLYQNGAGTPMNSLSSFSPIEGCAKYLGDYITTLVDQYGGNSYIAKTQNDFISCGHYTPIDVRSFSHSGTQTYTNDIFGGDTFVNVVDLTSKHARYGDGTFAAPLSEDPQAYAWYFGCESYINTHLRSSTFHNRYPPNLSSSLADSGCSVQEDFIYNSVYSCENDIVKFFPKPSSLNFTEVQEYDNRVLISQPKVNGEAIDSWSIFKEADKLDVDGTHGPINDIINFKDQIIGFQDSAIFTLNILPKFIIQSTTGTEEAQLGTGKALEGYSYISTEIGAKQQWAVCKGSFNGQEIVYFFDVAKKRLFRLSSQGLECISDTKGLSAFFRNRVRGSIMDGDNPFLSSGICCTYDYKFNEAWFTFKTTHIAGEAQRSQDPETTEESFTIAYSEPAQAFTSLYSFTPSIYISNGSKVISPNPAVPQDLYLHHYGNYGTFYGSLYKTTIKFIVNPDKMATKLLASIGYIGDVIDSRGVSILTDTWNRIRIYNTYQNTDWIDLVPGTTVARKESKWRANALRNAVVTIDEDIFDANNLNLTAEYPDRMRDTHFIVELEYNNSLDATTFNRKIILPYFSTLYNISTR